MITTQAAPPDTERVFAGGGECGDLARSVDWANTPIGPVDNWSQALRSAVALVLHNDSGMLLWWGPEFVQLYNNAYRPVLGDKHPNAMGQRFCDCWSEVFHILGPMAEQPFRGGPASTSDDIAVPINRKVPREESHFRLAYSPVPDDTVPGTGIGGVLATVAEITEQAYADRQIRTLRELARSAAETETVEHACTVAAEALSENPWDIPFALFYLLDHDGQRARRVAQAGFDDHSNRGIAPDALDFRSASARAPWPVRDVATTRRSIQIDDLAEWTDQLPRSPWSDVPQSALLLPLAAPDQPNAYGVLICGLSPHRVLDTGYRTFLELAAGQIATSIRNTRALEEERRRAEALAEIDRAKTAFFSNVSHEFRTPLTLMLGPIEELLTGESLSSSQRQHVELLRRNGLRLQKLVNSLLDFSRIEAGRLHASFEDVDLSALTRDFASAFRSAVEHAGLALTIDCDPLDTPAYVDRDMWEKVVLNLVSNAFKFTFSGGIHVSLTATDDSFVLRVKDTGVGIPADHVHRLFERFYRVEGSRARTHEGSGIGLALVQEIARMHGGSVHAESTPGVGTTFSVRIPKGSAHLPPESVARAGRREAERLGATAFVEEARRWLPDAPSSLPAVAGTVDAGASAGGWSGARILLVDDNADMRDYVRRLLETRWIVETADNGQTALDIAERTPPDLVLTDVMMPLLDGFGLLKALRASPATAAIPVIMLSARAGEEARIEGVQSGADDYLVKPFSARELMARVDAHLRLAEAARERETLLACERAARHEAQRANQLKDEFVALISHELRAPLQAVVSWLDIAKSDRVSQADVRRAIEVIDRNAQTQMRLINDLLDAARIATGKLQLTREPVDLRRAVDLALESVRPATAAKEIELFTDLDPAQCMVLGDAVRLQQVATNLLSNAVKFTPNRGRIEVVMGHHGQTAHLVVRDTGQGISSDTLPHIFERFHQGSFDPSLRHGGLGLGLAIVKHLVEAHGGTIRAASDGMGKGSSFTTVLPLMEQRP
jgi:signal transduction histidine kinase